MSRAELTLYTALVPAEGLPEGTIKLPPSTVYEKERLQKANNLIWKYLSIKGQPDIIFTNWEGNLVSDEESAKPIIELFKSKMPDLIDLVHPVSCSHTRIWFRRNLVLPVTNVAANVEEIIDKFISVGFTPYIDPEDHYLADYPRRIWEDALEIYP